MEFIFEISGDAAQLVELSYLLKIFFVAQKSGLRVENASTPGGRAAFTLWDRDEPIGWAWEIL